MGREGGSSLADQVPQETLLLKKCQQGITASIRLITGWEGRASFDSGIIASTCLFVHSPGLEGKTHGTVYNESRLCF